MALEAVGGAAYLGATRLISDKSTLIAAGVRNELETAHIYARNLRNHLVLVNHVHRGTSDRMGGFCSAQTATLGWSL